MYNKLVSIIIPVYNTEKYLPICLNSISEQTYTNIEIIAVNDGSTDSSLKLLEHYASKDSRIKIISQENKGSSGARETGIAAASGQYILIVDSDDWIDRDTVMCCLDRAQRYGSDCVMFGYIREYPSRSIENPLFSEDFDYDIVNSENKVHRRLVGPLHEELSAPEKVDNLVSMCMKLYRSETAKKGRIVSERIVGTSEDTIFNLYALQDCKISYINKCFYHYRKSNPQSITSHYKKDLSQQWDQLYQEFEQYIDLSGKSDDYTPAFLNRIACCTIGLGLNEVADGKKFLKQSKRLKNILNKPLYQQAFSQLNISMFPIKWQIFFIFCKYKCTFLVTILLHIINYLRSRITN